MTTAVVMVTPPAAERALQPDFMLTITCFDADAPAVEFT